MLVGLATKIRHMVWTGSRSSGEASIVVESANINCCWVWLSWCSIWLIELQVLWIYYARIWIFAVSVLHRLQRYIRSEPKNIEEKNHRQNKYIISLQLTTVSVMHISNCGHLAEPKKKNLFPERYICVHDGHYVSTYRTQDTKESPFCNRANRLNMQDFLGERKTNFVSSMKSILFSRCKARVAAGRIDGVKEI